MALEPGAAPALRHAEPTPPENALTAQKTAMKFIPSPPPKDSKRDTTILIVDDSATSRMLLEAILRGAGYTSLLMSASAEEALDLLHQTHPYAAGPDRTGSGPVDLILMDINMPGMNGIDAVRAIKGTPELTDIPVIMVTVSDEKENLSLAFAAGAIDYINKPVNKLELLARVNTVIRFREEMARRIANEKGLLDLTASLSEAYGQLEEMNQNLEMRVKERTSELEEAYAELKELDKMKTTFLSNVSHELRTPLTSVLGFTSIIRSRLQKVIFPELREPGKIPREALEKAMEQVESNIEILLLEAKRLTSRINDVLDISRMESGEVEWKQERVQFRLLLEQARQQVGPMVAEKRIELKIVTDPDLHEVLGDRSRLLQALMNLLTNAIKFTEQGGIFCTAENRGSDILVSVEDTGMGFPEAEYATVFEKFQQIGDSLTGKPQGVGLGVPICAYIIQHHGGRFWATSTPGKGSIFSFTLPAIEPHGRKDTSHGSARDHTA